MAHFHIKKHEEWMLKLSKCAPDTPEAPDYKIGDTFPLYAKELNLLKDALIKSAISLSEEKHTILTITDDDATHVIEMIDLKFGPIITKMDKKDYDRAKMNKITKSEILLVFKKKNVKQMDDMWVVSEISGDYVKAYESDLYEGDATPVVVPDFNTGDNPNYRARFIVFYKRVPK